jgi:hypothetical protein
MLKQLDSLLTSKKRVHTYSYSNTFAQHGRSSIAMSQKKIPIRHLGLSLSYKKLIKEDFLLIISKVQSRLAGRKLDILSPAGRRILLNSIFNELPMHYMQVFKLSSWLLGILKEKQEISFGEKNKCMGGYCLINWEKVSSKNTLGVGNS